MRPIKDPKLTTIPLSEIEDLKAQGFVALQSGDAMKANSDYFMVMVKSAVDGKGQRVAIVCPSFLRGHLGVSNVHGGFSY